MDNLISLIHLTEVIPKDLPIGLTPTVNVSSGSSQSTDKCTACNCACDCNDCWCSACK